MRVAAQGSTHRGRVSRAAVWAHGGGENDQQRRGGDGVGGGVPDAKSRLRLELPFLEMPTAEPFAEGRELVDLID